MYQALYRKWRPKTFEDVVGQAHITETLKRQVAEGRLSHAYLFTGTRGTGKTTCAKILAKAVNCEHPVNGNPCNACASCLGIESGGFLDVLELDAASNNGVDQVRALRDEAVYAPANVRKRVYIIDEVHMLSTAAFNALLKILEEPPEYVVFILTCDGVSRILETVRSRCFGLALGPLGEGDVIKALHAAGAQAPEDKLREAARCSGGIVGRALGFLAGEGLSEAASAAGEFSKLLCGGDEYAFLKLTAALAKDPAFTSSFIGLLPSLFRDAQAVKCGAGARLTGCDAAAQTLAHGLSGQCVDALCAQALGAQRALESNVRRELLLTGLFSALWSRAHDPDAV